ncbi:MAG: hypothetical protein HY321_14375 [Armatimonadetes bacterium]|nr:hypothetical protein [Armatimonadota bacterium]
MPEIKRGSFSLNLGFFQVQTEVSEEDRQCAWELYTEICTRRALTGKVGDPTCQDFGGEILTESLDSLYAFFREARGIMRRFPVGQLSADQTRHLGVLINDLMVNVLRPFLERWQGDFRHWWDTQADKRLPPFARQQEYPGYSDLIAAWANLRLLMRDLMKVLRSAYRLVDVQAGGQNSG